MAEAIYAEFDTPEGMQRAVESLRERGHHAIEAYSPFAVQAAFEPLRRRGSWLPYVALGAAVLGGVVAYAVQWYVNAWDYPQNAGGRPADAVPSFVFSTFEGLVLASAAAIFLALLFVLRLPRLWDPLSETEVLDRATDDRFVVLVRDQPAFLLPDVTVPLLRELGATRVETVEVGE